MDTYPGWGSFPTSQWPQGAVIADQYRLVVPPDLVTPTLLRIDAGLYDYATRVPYTGLTNSGAAPSEGLITLRVLPADPNVPPIAHPTAFAFDGRVRLNGFNLAESSFQPGQSLDLELFWQAVQPVGEDLQVFVHLLDADGRRVAGYDKSPLDGWWPTSAWEPGQVVMIRIP